MFRRYIKISWHGFVLIFHRIKFTLYFQRKEEEKKKEIQILVALEQNSYFTAKVTFQFYILTSNCFRLDHKSLMRADNSGVECLEKRDSLTEQWETLLK